MKQFMQTPMFKNGAMLGGALAFLGLVLTGAQSLAPETNYAATSKAKREMLDKRDQAVMRQEAQRRLGLWK
jgi:hypothetical protein